MRREWVDSLRAGLPGAEASDPWDGGHDAWKAAGRMFACIGSVTPGVSVKCADAETAPMLIESGVARRAPCFHRSWGLLPWGTAEEELTHRLLLSCRLIRARLPKKMQTALPAEA